MTSGRRISLAQPYGRHPRLLPTTVLCLALALRAFAAPAAGNASRPLERVSLQLKWTHAFQFAGYYAALSKGYYREAGLDVEIVEAKPGVDPVRSVLAGRAQYGVGTSSLLLERSAGKPVVALAVIFQHSPYVLIARHENATQNIHDLSGKRLMLEPQSDELLAYLKAEGIPLDRITRVEHSYDPQDLIDGRVDAIAGYVTNQPYSLDRAQFAYQIYTPRSAGIDFYGDNLFTTEQELHAHPARVDAFRTASLRGWQYAMAQPDEIVDLILAEYSQRHSREYFQFEAQQMVSLLHPELIEIGYMYPGRWRHIASTYADIGMLRTDVDLRGFLYDPHPPPPDLTWLYVLTGVATGVLSIVLGVAVYIGRINARLRREVTERKQAEEISRTSTARFRSYFELPLHGIAITSPEKGWIEVNDQLCALLGYAREEILRLTWAEMTHTDDLAADVTQFERLLSGQIGQYRLDKRFIRKGGEAVWTTISVGCVRTPAGGVDHVVCVMDDISARRHDEEALRQSEERFAKAFQTSPYVMTITRAADGRFIEVNAAFTALTGFRHDEALADSSLGLRLWANADDRRRVVAALSAGEPVVSQEFPFRTRTGAAIAGLLSAQVVQLGQEACILSSIIDITERKRAEAEKAVLEGRLQEAQRMESVGRLAGGVAHEFNNQLMGIMNYVELCRDELPPEHPSRSHLDEITHDAQHAADIARQLLAFARKQIIAPEILNLNDALVGMFKMLRRLLGEDIELLWMPGASLWPVRMDPGQINQIMLNLCINARDAIAGVGTITIETNNVTLDLSHPAAHPDAAAGDYVLLAIRDSGCGMSQDVLAHLFEPFFTTKEVGKGTVLGLATVHGIVSQNDGRISVCSEPGKGTTFRLYLPRATAPADPAAPSQDPSRTDLPRGTETILLAEDEKSVRLTTRRFLELLGYTVMVAETPAEALRLAAAHAGPIHLLITDVVMPNMNGRDLARQLGEARSGMKCLFMSGYTASVTMARGGLDADAPFLAKPFSRRELARTVRNVLGA